MRTIRLLKQTASAIREKRESPTWKGAGAVSERLTKRFNGGYGLINVKEDEQDVESKFPNTLQAILDSFDWLGRIEDALFDADGNEVISLARLRELAEAEREGRIETKTNDNKHDVRVCSNCQSIVHYDPYFKRYLCRTCGQESYLPQAAKEMMEAARALADPKGEATT